MKKEDLKKIPTVKMDNELPFQEYLTIVTDEDCLSDDFCKYFQSDPYWRSQFYHLRKQEERRLKENSYLSTEEQFEQDKKTKELMSDLLKLRKKFDFPDLNEIQSQVILLMYRKEKDKATELILEYIKSKTKLYTTRKDNGAQVYIYDNGIFVPNGETYIEEVTRLILQQAYNVSLCNNVKEKIKADTYIDESEFFEEEQDLIAVNNGILNIKTRFLLDFSENFKFFSKIPVNYDPYSNCDKIIEFFKDIIEFDDDIILLQELFGYLLYKQYPIEKAFMLLGKGRNGKGQLLELIKRFVGSDNCAAISLQKICDDTSFDISELHKKLVNIGGDIPDTFIKETGILKSLTGNDFISVRRKFLSNLNFKNYSKMIFACNKLPKSSDNSIGFWSRWILINFPYRFVDPEERKTLTPEEQQLCKLRKNDIISSLCDENQLSGLLNWALDGLDSLLERGYFTYTTSNKNVQDRWIKASDSFAAYCSERLVEDFNCHVLKDELRRDYTDYCRNNKIEAVGDRSIKNYLTREMGVTENRIRVADYDNYSWKNLRFVQGVQEDYEFYTLSILKNHKNIESKMVVNLGKLVNRNYEVTNVYKLIYDLIDKVQENNKELLFNLFTEELIQKMLQKGDLLFKDENTLRKVV